MNKHAETLRDLSSRGMITDSVVKLAESENITPKELALAIARGKTVIPANMGKLRSKPCAIGLGTRVKVNANIGTSKKESSLSQELEKLKIAYEAGADAVMDLSTGGDLDKTRKEISSASPIPLGTVPIYQAALEATEKHGGIINMDAELIFDVIERHAADGVDFMTIHSGVTLEAIKLLERKPRVAGIVSRGGAFLAAWMLHNRQNNPLYEQFDRLLDIAVKYDVTLSLGDGLRPGALADSSDAAQMHELNSLARQIEACEARGVQAIVEGPGHVPMNKIKESVEDAKKATNGAPLYLLGPLVTDIAAGYDHITAAIGGAIAAWNGADFLCYVTPREHLGLPIAQEVKEGVIASRIAAHAADIARGNAAAFEQDRELSMSRYKLDWEAQLEKLLDPEGAKEKLGRNPDSGGCTMCGPYCAMEIIAEYLGGQPAENC